jgi:hypothetical protein
MLPLLGIVLGAIYAVILWKILWWSDANSAGYKTGLIYVVYGIFLLGGIFLIGHARCQVPVGDVPYLLAITFFLVPSFIVRLWFEFRGKRNGSG